MLNRTVTATISTARRRNAPGVLPLHQPYRRANNSPQSPMAENIFLQRSMMTPGLATPSAIFVPVTPQPLTPGRNQQRLDNLTHCLKSSMPSEIIYPSFGQVCSEAGAITSFLDLYKKRVEEDEHLWRVKSPTSRESDGEWRALDDIVDTERRSIQRRPALRRSRSLSDLGRAGSPLAELTKEGDMDQVEKAEIPEIRLNGEGPQEEQDSAHEDPSYLGDAKATIVDADAKRMAEFRHRFGIRPRELVLSPVPPPTRPLPSPPPPSPLLSVQSPRPGSTLLPRQLPLPRFYEPLKSPSQNARPLKSPQAPYWVNASPMSPKTPRTLRNHRRQGWGGEWNTGGIGRVVVQLREI